MRCGNLHAMAFQTPFASTYTYILDYQGLEWPLDYLKTSAELSDDYLSKKIN